MLTALLTTSVYVVYTQVGELQLCSFRLISSTMLDYIDSVKTSKAFARAPYEAEEGPPSLQDLPVIGTISRSI
jgi:hypothetical protein